MKKLLIIGAAVFAVATSQGSTDNLPQRDSTLFDHKYELDVSLVDEDIDGDGYKDFKANVSISSPSSGVLAQSFNAGKYFVSGDGAGEDEDGGAWPKFVSALGDDGYTVEVRIKFGSQLNEWSWALATSDGNGCDTCLNFKTNSVCWGHLHYNTVNVTNLDTTASFHSYRVAKFPREARFAIWCDGVLLNDNLGDAFSAANPSRLLLGAIGGYYAGAAYVSYLRFTKGAYAPPPKRSEKDLMRDSAEFDIKYEMDSVPDSFIYQNTVTASSDNGVTEFNFAREGYYEGDADWTNLTALARLYGYTIELRAKVVGSTIDKGICLTASDNTDADAFLLIKNDSLAWGTGGTVITNMNTTADFHVYHLVRMPDEHQFMLWVDGNLVSDALMDGMRGKAHRFLFGAIGGSYGGTIDVDYLRYTSGVYYPYVPPKGTTITFR